MYVSSQDVITANTLTPSMLLVYILYHCALFTEIEKNSLFQKQPL